MIAGLFAANTAAAAELTSAASAQESGPPAIFADSPPARPLSLKRTLFKLKEGEVWEHWGSPIACDVLFREIRWEAGKFDGDADRLGAVFDEELTKAGLKSSESTNLFGRDSPSESLVLGAVIKDMNVRICGLWNDSATEFMYRGSSNMTVEWQVYDPIRQEVIGRVETTAAYEDRHRTRDAHIRMVIAAFRENARSVMTNAEFRKIVAVQSEASTPTRAGSGQPLTISMARGGKTAIADAAGAVVTVITADGHGSGFLISPDGYFITNQHVVGASATVRIRWSDGFEAIGEVVRSDKRRDVALIKAGVHSRLPLGVRSRPIRPGDTVFAIGTPLDRHLQGTVTKGVVSSFRLMDGLNYLQSDVVVNHGNSGGPLIDENGQVVAITVLSYRPEDEPSGINFFIPIGDALDFLDVKVTP